MGRSANSCSIEVDLMRDSVATLLHRLDSLLPDVLKRQRRGDSSRLRQRLLIIVAIGVFGICIGFATADDGGKFSAGEKLFAWHVKPLLAEKCMACHGADPDDIQGGLDLRSRDGLLAGGDSFGKDVAKLGHGQRSMLYVTVTRKEEGYEMPPKEADQLSEQQQWWLSD